MEIEKQINQLATFKLERLYIPTLHLISRLVENKPAGWSIRASLQIHDAD